MNLKASNPERLVFKTEHVICAIKHANRSRFATYRRDEETEKRENESHKTVTFHHRVAAPPEPISIKFGVFVGLTNDITYTKNGFKIFIGFSRPTSGKTHVSL